MDGAAAHVAAHLLLRDRTRDAHDAAEASAGMHALMSGTMDEAGYAGLLAAQLALFRAWENERSAEITAIAPVWAYASRIPALEADLELAAAPVGARLRAIRADENTQGPAAPGETMSRTRRAPTGGAAGAAFWGELYVIEGSALGGQVIVRHLRQRFSALAHQYYALGESAPGRWRHFQRALDDALPDAPSQHLALAGAQHMFARFQRTLQDAGHHD
ncbi:heme oxygenase [Luteibacter sp. 621]|uniref:biliverdin-producing heme oxygenase n=1 Tax=Luteibacter sp. 621 TaxID=3373916 RepID=UPI003D2133A0